MSKLYNNIVSLCESKGITGYRMCKEIGIQPSILTDLKMGRKEGLSSKNADKIARYFGVSVSFLLGTEEERNIYISGNYGTGKSTLITKSFDEMLQEKTKKSPSISDEDVKVALFGGDGEVTPEMWDDVRKYVEFVKMKYGKK